MTEFKYAISVSIYVHLRSCGNLNNGEIFSVILDSTNYLSRRELSTRLHSVGNVFTRSAK